MKVYYVEHKGKYIGGYTLIVAENEDEAKKIIKRKLREENLDDTYMGIYEVDSKSKGIFYFYNGDY